MIKAVFFDLDNTLYDFERAMRHGLMVALQHLFERLPNTRGRLSVELLVRLRERAAEEMGNPAQNLAEIRVESFRRALGLCGYDDTLAPEIAKVYFDNRFRQVRPSAGAVAALEQLRGRCVLGVISNGNTPSDILGLKEFFDHVIYSEAVGLAKPDPRIFQLAAQRVPCSARELLYVGDSVETDVMGAIHAGVVSAWFNPRGQRYPEGLARPDFEIADLAEVVNVVDAIDRG